MDYTNLSHCFTAAGLQLRALLDHARRSRPLALALLLVLGAALGAGSVAVQAQQEAAATQVATVNINTADAETLAARLKGVGRSRAQEIVRYRETYGRFTSAEELMEVKGIGPSTLDMNRGLITLD
ncbi:MAG: competence protein ComEA [Halioglobus sp.]|mgnify:CR=1 FL=1|nr:competence protein ComEA [Halioglobus sp.]|tara:strand:- start:458 stop:835 length:378 start_codon:yes stop_codon:yes gene_type:complete